MLIILYLLIFGAVLIIQSLFKDRVHSIKNIRIKHNGITFSSRMRHRIYIADARMMQVGTICYLKNSKNYVIIKNIDRVYIKDNYLYFKALGEVFIQVNMAKLKNYFNIYVESESLEFESMRDRAKLSLINHLFNMSEGREVVDYIKLVKRVLNIRFESGKVIVAKNKFNIAYTLYYKANNVIHKINIKPT